MGGPLLSIAPPHSVSSITFSVALRSATSSGTKDPPSCTAQVSSRWTTFSASCPQRTDQDKSLLTPVSRGPGLRGLRRGTAPLGVVFDNRRSRRSRTVALAGMAGAGGERRVLITFDVDGTLMHSTAQSANLLHKKAFSYAMKEVFGIDGTIDDIKHHGSTDQLILLNTLEHYGIPTETITAKLPELQAKMVEYAEDHSAQVGEGLDLLPGVASLLEILSKRNDVVVALVTGNLEKIGWLKMDGLGIRPFFSTPNFGGFGSDHLQRGELVKIAASRAKTLFPGEFSQRAHVGDTPKDIQAAVYGGALAIGVCTGIFSRADLQASSTSGNVVILDDLEDSGVFLKACGLE